jgi:hypothetical protein
MYNTARLILETRVKSKDLTCGWFQDITEYADTTLLKVHGKNQELLDRADLVLYSYRDIRDVLASMKRKWKQDPTLEDVDGLVSDCEFFEAKADYVMRYEDMIVDPAAEVARIADVLQIRVKAKTILKRLGKIKERPDKGKVYNSTNLYHNNHVTDGRHMSFSEQLAHDFVAEVEDRHGDWLEAHRYPLVAV